MDSVKKILADIQGMSVDAETKESLKHKVIHSAVELKVITPEEAAELGK